MAKVFWICPLVPYGLPNSFAPAAVKVLDSIGSHVSRWSTTAGNRAAPYAVGASSVDATQLAALEAENTVHLFTAADANNRFDQLPGAVRTRINNFFNNIGATRPLNNETFRDIAQRLVQLIDGKNIEDHLGEV